MDRRTGAIALLLLLLAIWLFNRRRTVVTDDVRGDKLVDGIPGMKYVVPPISDFPLGSRDPRTPFPWLGDDCACAIGRADVSVIESFRLLPRENPGYSFVKPPVNPTPILEALKLPPAWNTLTRTPTPTVYAPPPAPPAQPLPEPIIYRTPPPQFWWGWNGGARVIYTSDGKTLASGFDNRRWVRADGGNVFAEITAISYNGTTYQLRR